MDLRRSPSSIGSAGVGSSSVRKERGAIAAQACENCRNRKQRCDEARPKCGKCQKLGLECSYREPQPTKKDNTLQEILRRLTYIERELAELRRLAAFRQTQEYELRPLTTTTGTQEEPVGSPSVYRTSLSQPLGDSQFTGHGSFITPSTKSMMDWPIMQHLTDSTGTKGKEVEEKALPYSTATAAIMDSEQQPLSTEGLAIGPYATGATTPASFHYPNPPIVQASGATVVGWDTIQPLSKGFFDTFNLLYPIIDETWFMSNTVVHIMGGAESSIASALAFVVLALGEVALAGNAAPISQPGGRPSGIRGGTIEHPPGLQFFNEARHRLGVFVTEVSVENLQVMCLCALYYASCGRPGDCWRTASSATTLCQTLATRVHEAGVPPEVIRRLFYHCFEVSFVLGAELQLPITDLEHLRTYVGLPEFAGGQSEEDFISNQRSQFADYGQSQIFVHKFFSGLHNALKHAAMNEALSSPDIIRNKLRYFNEQLERWRELLPRHLSWDDDQFLGFTTDDPSPQLLIANDLIDSNMAYPYVTMMQIALVRSQYALGKHMLFRYCVYKVLHYPDTLQPEDYRGAAECLKAALKWPITMAPPSTNKRLVPLPFYWSQNVCGALVLLHLSTQHPMLSHIRTTYCGGQEFDYAASETIDLYIKWLRDMKQICRLSKRCWNIIQPLYKLRD
ncbi:hypothetical protein NLU13_3116 [Sarocladium strictum]|uniref:Zn(2)-C6 fungal-type domain-containing protein n=1 Tax=Sarocladium strictum TaxID=5046 RepID=A0AA39GLQ7_SARSR|nr:hypothetical protein NLU13_3116 [Sarocladium strictum]